LQSTGGALGVGSSNWHIISKRTDAEAVGAYLSSIQSRMKSLVGN
jgi:hypothetical protein